MCQSHTQTEEITIAERLNDIRDEIDVILELKQKGG